MIKLLDGQRGQGYPMQADLPKSLQAAKYLTKWYENSEKCY